MLIVSFVNAQPYRGQPEKPVPHPPVVPITPQIPNGKNEPIQSGIPPLIKKTDVDEIKSDLLPTAGELQLSTAMLACRKLDSQYESLLAGERQMYTRILDISKKEKTAVPNELIELRKKVDDLNLSMLKLKQERVQLSEEMGDILLLLTKEEQEKVIKELNLKQKVELYKNVMVILQKEKEQKAKEDKVIFEMKVRDKIEHILEKLDIERKVVEDAKKEFYSKTTEAEVSLKKIKTYLEDWRQVIEGLKTKDLCKFQFMETLKHMAVLTHTEISYLRQLLKDARKQRHHVYLLLKNAIKKSIAEFIQLKKENKDIRKQALIKPEIEKLESELKIIKKTLGLKGVEVKLGKQESRMSAIYLKRIVSGNSVLKNTKSKCKFEPIWKLDNVKGVKLFKHLTFLESKFKKTA